MCSMEYYSDIKKTGITYFAGKWIEWEKTLLSVVVIQTQKEIYFLLLEAPRSKFSHVSTYTAK